MVRLLVGFLVGVFFRSEAHVPSIVGAEYPRRGSNPRWTGFKPVASAIGLRGQKQSCAPRLFRVVEKTLARFLAQMPRLDELPEHLGCVRAFSLAVAVLERPITDVEAAEVEQVEWTHRPVEALLHRDVDVLGTRVTTF